MNADRADSFLATLWRLAERGIGVLDALRPAAQLLARWTLAGVFFRSGLTKLRDWDITLALFMDEYHVPLLNTQVAAFMGTAAELVLPVLLLLGLGGRVAAAGLFILNIVAVFSVPDLPVAALQQHVFWGSLLAGLLLWGPGRWSADAWVAPWLRRRVLGGAPVASRYTAAAFPNRR